MLRHIIGKLLNAIYCTHMKVDGEFLLFNILERKGFFPFFFNIYTGTIRLANVNFNFIIKCLRIVYLYSTNPIYQVFGKVLMGKTRRLKMDPIQFKTYDRHSHFSKAPLSLRTTALFQRILEGICVIIAKINVSLKA